jgi:hypothetical protein
MALPANQLPVGEGVGPDGQTRMMFYIDRNELDKVRDEGPPWKFEDIRFIIETVDSPDAIFQGLGRHDHEESLCYSARVTHDPEEPEKESLPRYGHVFLVFVRPCVGGYLVFDWEWREEDDEHPGYPGDWEKDFKERVWPAT